MKNYIFPKLALTMTSILIIALCVTTVFSQPIEDIFEENPPAEFEPYENPEILELIENEEYDAALEILDAEFIEYYLTFADETRLPNDFITIESVEQDIDLVQMFRMKTNEHPHIEINGRMYFNHIQAAIAYRNKGELDRSLTHLFQAHRFSKIRLPESEELFYNLAQTYLATGKNQAYLNMLETCYELNPINYDYSYELGKALYRTRFPEKSIFHLERYLESVAGDTDDLEVYLMLAGLKEQVRRYLDAANYYRTYLEKVPDNGNIWYAFGFLLFNNIGNYREAEVALNRALETLPEEEILKLSKSYEMLGDMLYRNLKYREAIDAYLQTLQFQDTIAGEIEEYRIEIAELTDEIRELRVDLLQNKDYTNFTRYQFSLAERDRVEQRKRQKEYEFRKLNAGKVRWNLALCYEYIEEYEEAIRYYRETIRYNYNPNKSRENITRLQLRITRGY